MSTRSLRSPSWCNVHAISPGPHCESSGWNWTRSATPTRTCVAHGRDAKNEDIAASIIGFVRQAALGDALLPYPIGCGQRCDAFWRAGMDGIQRKWLKRIDEQLEREIVVDRSALDEEPFSTDGGFARLNKIFDGSSEAFCGDIRRKIWRMSGNGERQRHHTRYRRQALEPVQCPAR